MGHVSVPTKALVTSRVRVDASEPERYGPLLFDLRHLGLWQPKRVEAGE